MGVIALRALDCLSATPSRFVSVARSIRTTVRHDSIAGNLTTVVLSRAAYKVIMGRKLPYIRASLVRALSHVTPLSTPCTRTRFLPDCKTANGGSYKRVGDVVYKGDYFFPIRSNRVIYKNTRGVCLTRFSNPRGQGICVRILKRWHPYGGPVGRRIVSFLASVFGARGPIVKVLRLHPLPNSPLCCPNKDISRIIRTTGHSLRTLRRNNISNVLVAGRLSVPCRRRISPSALTSVNCMVKTLSRSLSAP